MTISNLKLLLPKRYEEIFVHKIIGNTSVNNLILSSSMYKRDGLHGEKRVIDMCHNLQATEYYNAIGGRDLYSKETFLQKNILLKFVKMKDIAYKQFSQNFVKNLSIIDIMMFNDKQAMTELLNAFEVL